MSYKITEAAKTFAVSLDYITSRTSKNISDLKLLFHKQIKLIQKINETEIVSHGKHDAEEAISIAHYEDVNLIIHFLRRR